MSGTLYAVYGDDGLAMAKRLLDAMKMAEAIPSGAAIAIKPNLVVSHPASGGATTHPEIVAGIIEYLQDNGRREISIIEGSWVGDSTARAFSACGYAELSKRYNVPLHDLKTDSSVAVDTPAGPIRICSRALDAGFLVNVPVLKGHCQTRMTCALKNMKGCIPDSEKRRFHAEGLDRLIGALAAALIPNLTLVDGLCGDLDFEEGGTPVKSDRMFAGTDPVLIDAYGARLMGIPADEIGYLRLAEEFGAGSSRLAEGFLVELNRPSPAPPGTASGWAKRLAGNIREDKACSACRGGLLRALKRLDDLGILKKSPPVAIGQGWRGRAFAGPGIGDCCRGGGSYAQGCPPDAEAIVRFLSGRQSS